MARWALLLYRMPAEPSAPRVAVWRALKRLDGGYLQDGSFAAPHSEDIETQLRILAHDIRNQEGEATMVISQTIDDERHLKQRLRANRPAKQAKGAA
jgi:DNA-binding transcriptional regulator PaaX